jgi:hypothetical protein
MRAVLRTVRSQATLLIVNCTSVSRGKTVRRIRPDDRPEANGCTGYEGTALLYMLATASLCKHRPPVLRGRIYLATYMLRANVTEHSSCECYTPAYKQLCMHSTVSHSTVL